MYLNSCISKKILSVTLLLGFLVSPVIIKAQADNFTIEGYGELHLSNIDKQVLQGLDYHRLVVVPGYHLSSDLSVYTELEVNHPITRSEENIDLTLSQAFIEYLLTPVFGIRTGVMNPHPEPTMYFGVERPKLESFFTVTSWKEFGVAFFGSLADKLTYEAYVMTGIDSGELSQEGNLAINNYAVATLVEYQISNELKIGSSYFLSDLKNNVAPERNLGNSFYSMIEGHAEFFKGGFTARVFGGLSVNSIKWTSTVQNTDRNRLGAHLELAYDLMRFWDYSSDEQLYLFSRGEVYRINFSPGYGAINPSSNIDQYTFGISYQPIDKIAFKADFQYRQVADLGNTKEINLGFGYSF